MLIKISAETLLTVAGYPEIRQQDPRLPENPFEKEFRVFVPVYKGWEAQLDNAEGYYDDYAIIAHEGELFIKASSSFILSLVERYPDNECCLGIFFDVSEGDHHSVSLMTIYPYVSDGEPVNYFSKGFKTEIDAEDEEGRQMFIKLFEQKRSVIIMPPTEEYRGTH